MHFQHRRRWHTCTHPQQPFGPNVCAAMGCGPTCSGYQADPEAEPIVGLQPLWQRRLKLSHPLAFNASIIEYRGFTLLAYRTPPPHSRIRIGSLSTDSLNEWHYQELTLLHPKALLGQEDPRLFVHNGRLHVAFCGVEAWPEHPHKIKANVLYARLNEAATEVEEVFYPHYEGRNAWEKNWAFFSQGGKLYCVYNIKPHTVLEIEGHDIVREYKTETPLAWHGGHLRGGAAPVLHDGKFYHFFHGRVGAYRETTYNTGLYTFEPEPPFRPIAMTRDPLQWADHDGKIGEQTFGAAVVFVGGAIRTENTWVVSQGVNDRCVELQAWDAQAVEDLLVRRPPLPDRLPPLPPVYAIYCDELPERKETLRQHLRERKVEPHWWRSVHGKTWGLTTRKVYVEGESPINAGQAGLILGHYMLWQHLEAIGAEEAIIIEDDCVLDPDFHEKFAAARRHFPEDAGLVYIGHLGCHDRIKRRLGGGVASLTFVPWATHCYWVHKRALKVLLDRMRELRNPVDSQLWYNVLEGNHIAWYAVDPSMASQRSASGLCETTLSGFNDWEIHPEPLRTHLSEAVAEIKHGWCVLEKARMLAGLVMRERPKVVVELGVYGGKSLVPLALALRQLDEGGVVYGVDPWTVEAVKEGYPEDDANRQWWQEVPLVQVYHEFCYYLTHKQLWPWVRLLCAPSQDVVHVFDHQPIDILHIDGNHSEAASLRDVRLWLPRVPPGGWVWFDDTNWESTKKAQRELECSCRLVIDAPGCGGGLRLYRKLEG